MEQKIIDAYESYITLGEEIKTLTDKRKDAQAVIKKYHTDLNMNVICENGYKSQIIPQTSTSTVLDEAKLIEKFGADALKDCYTTKTSTKMNFRCDRMILG